MNHSVYNLQDQLTPLNKHYTLAKIIVPPMQSNAIFIIFQQFLTIFNQSINQSITQANVILLTDLHKLFVYYKIPNIIHFEDIIRRKSA